MLKISGFKNSHHYCVSFNIDQLNGLRTVAGCKENTQRGQKKILHHLYFFMRSRVKGSPGANTTILSGLTTTSFRSFGSALKGGKSGASTDPQ